MNIINRIPHIRYACKLRLTMAPNTPSGILERRCIDKLHTYLYAIIISIELCRVHTVIIMIIAEIQCNSVWSLLEQMMTSNTVNKYESDRA